MLFKELANDIIFYTRDAKFGYIKVKSKDKVTAASNVTKLLRIKERIFFPIYLGKKKSCQSESGENTTRNRSGFGQLQQCFRERCMGQKQCESLNPQQLKSCVLAADLFLSILELDLRNVAKKFVLPEREITSGTSVYIFSLFSMCIEGAH